MWEVELGRVGILLETTLISAYLSLPCRGHIEHIFHIFRYIKVNPKIKLCFDPQHLEINKCLFAAHNYYDFYRDAKEVIPADAPTPRGNVVSTHFFVDADHARDKGYQEIPDRGPNIC